MWGLDWHCAGNVIATACSDKAVRLYDIDLNKVILTIEQQQSNDIKFDLQPYTVIRGAQRVISGVEF